MSQDTKPTDSTEKPSLFGFKPSASGSSGPSGLFGSKPNPPASGSLFGSGPASTTLNKSTSSEPKADDSKPKSLGLGAAFNPTSSAGSTLFAGAAKPSDDKKPETGVTGIKSSGNPSATGLFGGSGNKPGALGGATEEKKEEKTEEKKPVAGGSLFSSNPTATGSSGGTLFGGGIKQATSGPTTPKEEKKSEPGVIGNKFSGNPSATGSFGGIGDKPATLGGATETKTEEKKPASGGTLFSSTPSVTGSSGGTLFGGGIKPLTTSTGQIATTTTEEKKSESGVIGTKFSGNPTATGSFGGIGGKPAPLGGVTETKTEDKKPEIKPLSMSVGGAAPGLNLTGNNKPLGASTGPALGGGLGLGAGFAGKAATPQATGGMLGSQMKATEGGEMSVERVLDKWKNDLSNKAKEFEALTQNIVEYEKQIMTNLEVEQELVKELEKMENEYKAVEFSLEGIMKGQDHLAERVEELESGLSKYQYPNEGQKVNKEKMSREDLIKLAEGMNKEIEGMDNEILKLIEEMSKSAEKKDSGQLTENVLGNYLKTLQFIEAETLKAMTQMNKIENHLANQ